MSSKEPFPKLLLCCESLDWTVKLLSVCLYGRNGRITPGISDLLYFPVVG